MPLDHLVHQHWLTFILQGLPNDASSPGSNLPTQMLTFTFLHKNVSLGSDNHLQLAKSADKSEVAPNAESISRWPIPSDSEEVLHRPWKLAKHIFSQHFHPNSATLLLVILSRLLSNCIVWPSFPLYIPCPISPGIYLQSHSFYLHWIFCYQWFSVIVRCVLLVLYSAILLFCYQWVSVACTRSNCIMCSASTLSTILLSVVFCCTLCTLSLYTPQSALAILLSEVFCCTLSDCKVCSATPLSVPGYRCFTVSDGPQTWLHRSKIAQGQRSEHCRTKSWKKTV